MESDDVTNIYNILDEDKQQSKTNSLARVLSDSEKTVPAAVPTTA